MLLTTSVYAHPGGTAADGCHYCRTNCSKWGEVEGARHCHGGGSAAPQPITPKVYSPPPKPTTPNCPANSSYNSSEQRCICNEGYAASLTGSQCIKIPVNAHISNNGIDVWECNNGYKEVGNTCVFIEPEAIRQEAVVKSEIEIETVDSDYDQIEESHPEIPQSAELLTSAESSDEDEEVNLSSTDVAITLGVLGGMGYGLWFGVKKVIGFIKVKI